MTLLKRDSGSTGWRLLRLALGALVALPVACSVFGSSLDSFTEGGGGKQPSCDATQKLCGTLCVDTSSSPDHCGDCGSACPGQQVCDQSACSDTCSGGRTACNRACVDTQTDPQHCGDCDTFCTTAEICSNGKCATSCATGQTQCGGSCVDTQTDDQNCGACNTPCSLGQKCAGGSCVVSCNTGQTECGGVCVDTQSNVYNCGSCGNACNAGEACTAGKCAIACPPGQTACGGQCTDTLNDNANCGACGTACVAPEKCGNAQCAVTCPTGQDVCAGACVDLQSDMANCGTCGNACTSTQECSAGTCVIACKTLLNQPIADPWGFSWDGLERAVTTYDQAKTTCEGIGGRLPTASELYRVSATQSATVGQTINTNYLWSTVPYNPTSHVRVRLSDATINNVANTTNLNYRCVCPPSLPKAYVGGNCFGPVGQACYGLDGEGKRYNMDVADRAPLSKGAAIWECTFYRGHLATPIQYAEAIQQGIGAGSNTWLHTANDVHYSNDALVSWSDPTTWKFQYTGSTNAMSWGNTSNFRPFRCAGVNYEAGTHPVTITNEFVGPLSGYKGEADDNAAAIWPAPDNACLANGGHVPTSTELTELIQQGLPNGSHAWLLTSDQAGWNGTQFLLMVKRWTGTELDHQDAYTTDLSWAYRTQSNAYRCIYYPVDTGYTGPASGDCAGGCFELALSGGSGAKIWLDSFDRAPPANAAAAVATCRGVGGHLASERDLTELIRAGLPNGSGTWIMSGDPEIGDGANGSLLMGVVKWSATDTSFSDQYSTYSTWGNAQTAIPYRCAWTNELR
jgi:Stigma-specific protein, Stig1